MKTKAEQGQATRAHLVTVARDLFVERGYEDAPLEEILRRAGVSKGALYHHFPNKEELFAAVAEQVEEEVMAHIAREAMGETDALEMLRAAVKAWLDLIMDPKMRRICLIDGPAVLGWQRWREIDEKYSFGLARKVLSEAMAAGRIRTQPVDMLTHVVLAALGEIAMVIARADDPKQARREADDVVAHLLVSLAAP